MRCLSCKTCIRNPKGVTRDLQKCASCRGMLGRGDKKILKPVKVTIKGRSRKRINSGRYHA